MTVEVAGRSVTYQEISMVSPPEFEFTTVFPGISCCGDGDDCGSGVSGGGDSAGPSTSTGGFWCCTAASLVPTNVAGGEASEGPIAGGKAPFGVKDDAVAIPSPTDCGTNDEGDGAGVTDGVGLFL